MKLKQSLFALVLAATSTGAVAAEGDLVLEGEKYSARFKHYTCSGFDNRVLPPIEFDDMDLRYEKLATNRAFDTFILVARFNENGAACRYSVILKPDFEANTASAIESKAFAPEGDSDCMIGKEYLDGLTKNFAYDFTEEPYKIGLKFAVESAADLCGEGATTVSSVFVH
jgi:hypothetical protein